MEEFLSSFGGYRPTIQQFIETHHLTDINLLQSLAHRPSISILIQEFIQRGLGEWESTFLASKIFSLNPVSSSVVGNNNNGNVTLADVVSSINQMQGAFEKNTAILQDISFRLSNNVRNSEESTQEYQVAHPINQIPFPASSYVRIAVGEADNPHRIMINHSNLSQTEWNNGASMTIAGWKNKMEFWAFPTEQPGTIRIAVGEAHNPHRIMINHSNKTQTEWNNGALMTIAGWHHKMEFWVYPTRQPGTIRIAVGEAYDPHRLMFNHSSKSQTEWDNGASMTIAGWQHKMEFWVYPTRPE